MGSLLEIWGNNIAIELQADNIARYAELVRVSTFIFAICVLGSAFFIAQNPVLWRKSKARIKKLLLP